MKRKIVFLQAFLTVLLLIVCSVALFACGGKGGSVPTVKDVKITAVDGNSYGKAGALHQVSYTAPEGSEISVSVKLGSAAATAKDFSCSEEGYRFYTLGEYTVTVYAAKGGMVGSASTKITVTEGAVSDVKISAATGEPYGKVGALHLLTYTAASGSDIQVEITKGGAATTDVDFNDRYNTLIFRSAGEYTVTVKVTAPAESSASATIEITDDTAVTLTLDKTTVVEDGEVLLETSVTFSGGDVLQDESVIALYRAGATEEFLAADEDSYTLNGNRLLPHVAGEWKIIYRAHSASGAVSEASATFQCTPAAVSLLLKTDRLHRIGTNIPTDIDYLVEGAAGKYDITYDFHGASGIAAEKGEGNSVRITATAVDYFTVTIVYTHKVDKTLRETLDITLYSVESLTYAPVWGEDPFDGMPSEVLTSMGHLLYFDASSSGGVKRELTSTDVKYQIIENNVTATSGSNAVEVLYGAGDNQSYPYVIVENFDNNVAQGNFTLKMTLTDPYTGYSAVAVKRFTVLPTTNDNANAAKFIQNYVEQYSDFYQMGDMDYTNLCSDCRHNMILTKTGTIMQRSNPSWTLNGNNADFAQMDFATAAANCRLEFKFTLLAPNPSTGEVWLGVGVRTSVQTGWVGFFDLHIVGGKLDITNGLSGTPTAEYTSSDSIKPLAENGATLYVRIDRRVNGSLAEYTVYAKTEEGDAYQQYYRCTYNSSSSAGNAGAPVKQYQFTHRNAGGCYAVENVTVTNYDA